MMEQLATTSSRHQRVATHRGWPLSKSDHIILMQWAISCVEHGIDLMDEKIDDNLTAAFVVARWWCEWNCTVWDARDAAFQCHAIARNSDDQYLKTIARAIGHAVATAHMADHAPKAAEYALVALAYAGYTLDKINQAKEWQNSLLPWSIKQLVLDARNEQHNFWDKQIQKALSQN